MRFIGFYNNKQLILLFQVTKDERSDSEDSDGEQMNNKNNVRKDK